MVTRVSLDLGTSMRRQGQWWSLGPGPKVFGETAASWSAPKKINVPKFRIFGDVMFFISVYDCNTACIVYI